MLGQHEKYGMAKQAEVSRFLHPATLLNSPENSMCKNLEYLIMYSKTNSTWQKHCAAWNALTDFFEHLNQSVAWPLDINKARQFVIWALQSKKLKSNTVKTYLSSIRLAHTLGELSCSNFEKDAIIKMALCGAKNLSHLHNDVVHCRPPMSLSALKILGHRLACTDWKEMSVQVVWTACLVSFFSSCRMGEIVSPSVKSFDPKTTLLWKHVNLSDSHATIFVPYSKMKGLLGHTLEIFPFGTGNCCPFSALITLKNMLEKNDVYSSEKPVFTFESGKFLTVNKLNELLDELLGDLCHVNMKFSCHSFRAAIPTLISNYPDKSFTADIMDWGEWDSPTYKLYTKRDFGRKKFLFDKICTLLDNSCENK